MWYGEAKRIYILPLGSAQEILLEELRAALEKRFGKEAQTAPEIPLPRYAYKPERSQCNSTLILEGLSGDARKLLSDGMLLAVIDCDLYADGLNFVFGEADPVQGAAVISLVRLREEFYGERSENPAQGWELFLERAVEEAVHEMGHLYGFSHCPNERCVMHFSNSLPETDRKSAGFCRDCSLKFKSL
jgi:archaemetzincin